MTSNCYEQFRMNALGVGTDNPYTGNFKDSKYDRVRFFTHFV
jgi:hypothetical protein